MTTSEAARMKGVTRAAIANAIRRGAIPASKMETPRGPVWDIQPADLAAWTPGHPRTAGSRTAKGAVRTAPVGKMTQNQAQPKSKKPIKTKEK